MKLAVIGTGGMGSAVAERLAAKSHEVTVFNRSRSRAEALESFGVRVADTAREAMEAAEGIVSLVVDSAAMRTTVLAPEALEALNGRTLLKMTTSTGADTAETNEIVSHAGGRYVDVALLSFPDEVRRGQLHALIGASKEDYESWLDVLRDLGPKMVHVGEVGSASIAENALLQMMMYHIVAFANGLAMFERANIPVEALMDVVQNNPLFRIPLCDYFLPRMRDRDFEPALYRLAKHKRDIELTLADMNAYGVNGAALQVLRDVFDDGVRAGHGEKDYTVIYDLINPRT